MRTIILLLAVLALSGCRSKQTATIETTTAISDTTTVAMQSEASQSSIQLEALMASADSVRVTISADSITRQGSTLYAPTYTLTVTRPLLASSRQRTDSGTTSANVDVRSVRESGQQVSVETEQTRGSGCPWWAYPLLIVAGFVLGRMMAKLIEFMGFKC